jgi:superfamily II DNA or RNA helicase
VEYIKGEIEIDDREIVKQQMEIKNDMIVVAMSSIFSTGVNIKNIHMIIFAAGGKSFIRVVQSIGRGLRKNDNKQKLTIIDLCDNLKYGNEHAMHRQKIYEQEKIQFNVIPFIEK